jgi:hypothetical protein
MSCPDTTHEDKGCRKWREMSDERGSYEYCLGDNKECTCAGIKEECKNGLYDNVDWDREPDEDMGRDR